MLEGDSILRTARSLRAALQGATVRRGDPSVPQVLARAPGVGRGVTEREACGKHLLVWLVPGELALLTHVRLRLSDRRRASPSTRVLLDA